ncbi:hypothetical protein Ndes2526B_g08118 [Nannochloris sp. 'desiccata']|nr:hypothetical protein KSW81_002751 [Chlorella desiccata (nom. nud.)]
MNAPLRRVYPTTLPNHHPRLNSKNSCKAKLLPKRFSSRLHVYSEDEEACDIADQSCFSVSLRLQDTKLQLESAVLAEEFDTAARLRDQLQNLELTHRSIAIAQTRQENVLFTVGTCMRHRVYGYRGVIVGYDLQCLAPTSWKEQMRVSLLAHGAKQPFYHVLVDVRDRPGGQTTYIAQENVVPSRVPHTVEHPLVERYLQILRTEHGKSWQYLPRAELRELYKDDF